MFQGQKTGHIKPEEAAAQAILLLTLVAGYRLIMELGSFLPSFTYLFQSWLLPSHPSLRVAIPHFSLSLSAYVSQLR